MALIKCSECGKEISSKAKSCPNCGNPMNQQSQQEEYLCCPKCGSRELHAEHKGFSGGKALVGALVTGGIGLLAGTIGSKDTQITCLKCGKKFKAGEAVVKTVNGDNDTGEMPEEESTIIKFLQTGEKLPAVKWYKERHNCGMKEALDAVDEIAAKHITDLPSNYSSGSGCSIIILIGISVTLGAMFML